MDNESTTANENPYQSPLTTGQEVVRPKIEYPSAAKAFLAGAKRGAKSGGKWTALVLLIPLAALVIFVFVSFLRFTLKWGFDSKMLLGGLALIGWQSLFLAYMVFAVAFATAIGRGMREALVHRRSHKNSKATPTSRP